MRVNTPTHSNSRQLRPSSGSRREPRVPFSPLTNSAEHLSLANPSEQFTPTNSPTGHQPRVITPNPLYSEPRSLEWDNIGCELEGAYRRRNALSEVISGIENLIDSEPQPRKPSLTDPNLIDTYSVHSNSGSSQEVQSLEFSSANTVAIRMTNPQLQTKLTGLRKQAREVHATITDFGVKDVGVERLAVVERDLDRIWNQATKFRNYVWNCIDTFSAEIDAATKESLEVLINDTISKAKAHAKEIRAKVHEIAPVRPMSEFERATIAQQNTLIELQKQTQAELREQNKKTNDELKAQGLVKASAAHKKVLDGCSQLVLDIDAGKDDLEWKAADDDTVRKAMRSKESWLKKIDLLGDEFMKYEVLIKTWDSGQTTDDKSEFSQLKNQYDVTKRAVEKAVEEVEVEDISRNLYTLELDVGTKLEYPKFSGKFSECFLKFKDKMLRAFKSNRVAKVDQVDKLRECLGGFALSLVPDSMKDIDAAFQALSDQWDDQERVLESLLKELKGIGNML